MKVKIEAECTPTEARSFIGLPDVTPLNDHLVAEMKRRMDSNMSMLKPDELLKNWSAFGGHAQDQLIKLLMAAASNAASGFGSTKS